MGCLVYQMIRPTYKGCCERKKNHETIHSIKAIYPQNFVFLALTTPLSEIQMVDPTHNHPFPHFRPAFFRYTRHAQGRLPVVSKDIVCVSM